MVSVLKQLDPLIAVVSLALCMLLYGQKVTPALGAVAVLTFVIASRVFGRSNRDDELAGKPFTTVFSRILLEWVSVVCILLFAGFAFKVSEQFSRLMMLTWFAITPVALYAERRNSIGLDMGNPDALESVRAGLASRRALAHSSGPLIDGSELPGETHALSRNPAAIGEISSGWIRDVLAA